MAILFVTPEGNGTMVNVMSVDGSSARFNVADRRPPETTPAPPAHTVAPSSDGRFVYSVPLGQEANLSRQDITFYDDDGDRSAETVVYHIKGHDAGLDGEPPLRATLTIDFDAMTVEIVNASKPRTRVTLTYQPDRRTWDGVDGLKDIGLAPEYIDKGLQIQVGTADSPAAIRLLDHYAGGFSVQSHNDVSDFTHAGYDVDSVRIEDHRNMVPDSGSDSEESVHYETLWVHRAAIKSSPRYDRQPFPDGYLDDPFTWDYIPDEQKIGGPSRSPSFEPRHGHVDPRV